MVTGLASGSTGLVLQDNAIDNLTISGNGTFTFKTAIVSGKGYNVSISTPPTTPPQTCTVANFAGKAAANVTNVQVTCSTGTLSIGGTVVGLLGIGLVLQNNGGDDVAIATSNPFTFPTAVAISSMYSVTVSRQPTTPTQTCTVTNGTGTANTNVGNIQITCSIGTISVGGTITGLSQSGSGMVLQDNGVDTLTVKANGTFTMPTLLIAGAGYKITILNQPSGPNQACVVTQGSGIANVNVTNVQIVCPAIFHTIGGTVVGLVGTTSKMVLQNNLGDNLTVTSNGAFTFNTSIADGSTYDVSLLSWNPDSQPGVGVVLWGYQGTATAAVTSIIVDCGHNDWSWFDGSKSANQNGTFTTPTPIPPTFDADSPGGRKYPATWTDSNGNLWLFGGFGLTFTPGLTPPATELNDMWEYTGTQNYFGSYNNIWTNLIPAFTAGPAPRTGAVTWTQPGAGGDLFLFGGEGGGGGFFNDVWRYHIVPGSAGTWTHVSGGANLNGAYGTQNVPSVSNFPGSRWGATGRFDASSGKVWIFGGYGFDSTSATPGLLNDLWTYDPTTTQWTWVSGSKTANQSGNYGTLGQPLGTNIPGARETSMSWIDASGNFWLFGGFDLDSVGSPAALNDLWEFNGTQWTWKSGANVSNQTGVYGTQGVAAGTNVPGARWSSAAWTDAVGNFWLFGGQGYDSTGNGSLSDLWAYTGGQWVWVKGPASVSQAGVYGTTTPGPTIYPYVGNGPGSRIAPGYWIDTTNQFWIFGGEGEDSSGSNGNGLLNDLWRYVPYPRFPSQN